MFWDLIINKTFLVRIHYLWSPARLHFRLRFVFFIKKKLLSGDTFKKCDLSFHCFPDSIWFYSHMEKKTGDIYLVFIFSCSLAQGFPNISKPLTSPVFTVGLYKPTHNDTKYLKKHWLSDVFLFYSLFKKTTKSTYILAFHQFMLLPQQKHIH